jgi:PAS domain S-box-containing protein
MLEFAARLFDPSGFVPRAECGAWTPGLIALHLVSDVLIWVAYVSIPIVLLAFARRRDLPYPRLFVLFAAFILACGFGHLLDALMFRYPLYRLSGLWKAVTAAVSLATAFALVPVVRRLFAVEPGKLTSALDAVRGGGFGERGVSGWVTVAWGVAVVGLVANTAASSYNTNVLIRNEGLVNRTRDVRQELARLLSDVKDVETGQRGFQITGADDYLQPYRDGTAAVARRLAALDELLAGDPDQADDYARLKGLVAAKVAESDRLVEVRRTGGRQAGWEAVGTGAGKEIMDDLRATAGRMDGREEERLARQREVAREKYAAGTANNLAGAGMALVMLLFGYGLIRWEFGRRLRAEAALSRSEAQFRTLSEAVPQMVWVTRPDGHHEYYNARWYEYTGLTAEQSLGRGWSGPLHPDDRGRAEARWKQSTDTGTEYEIEYRFRRADGAYRWFLGRARPERDEAGNVVRWFGTCTDIHDRRELEAEFRQVSAILNTVNDHTPTLIYVKDRQGRAVMYNPATLRVLGKPASQVIGRTDAEHLPPGPAAAIMAADRRVMETGEVAVLEEYPDPGPDGRVFLSVKSPYRDEGGAVTGLIGVSVDITDRKRMEADLRRGEERLRLAVGIAQLGTFEIDLATDAVVVNDRGREIYGWADTRTTFRKVQAQFHPDDAPEVLRRVQAALDPAGPRSFEVEQRIVRADGALRWLRVRGQAFFDGRTAVRLLGSYLDVTDQKEAADALRESEASLRRSEATLRAFYDSSPLCMGVVEALGDDVRHVYDNRASCRFFGVETDKTAGRRATELGTPPDVLARWLGRYRESAARGGPVRFEYDYPGADGRRWLSATVAPLDVAADRFCYVAEDVTDRKRAEEAVRVNEERLRLATEATGLGVWASDAPFDRSEWSDRLREIYQLPPGAPATREEVGRRIHPADLAAVAAATAAATAPGGDGWMQVEHRVVRPDGEVRWLDVRGRATFAAGRAVRLAGVALDVTDRRRAEEAVRTSEERYRTLTEAIPQIVWNADPAGEVTYFNRRWLDYTGLPLDRAAGRGWLDAVHPDDRDRVGAEWRDTIETGNGSADRFAHELRLKDAGGGYRWFLSVAVPLRRPDGTVDQWIGSMADVHDGKTAAERVAESERFLAATIDALTKHLAVLDERGTILRVNEAWRRFGEENGLAGAAGGVGSDYLAACEVPCPGGDGASFSDAIRGVIRGDRRTFEVDYPCHSPSARRWFQMRVSRFPGDGPVRVVVTHDDITARVLAEEATRESEAKFRFLDALGQATRDVDPGGVMAVTTRLLGEHLGVTRCAYAEVEPDADRFHIRHDWTDGAASTVGTYSLDAFGPRAAADQRAGRPLVIRDVDRELAPAGGADTFNAIGIKGIVCCPLVKGGRLTAMMAVHAAAPRDWAAGEVSLVREVCERSWAHIELQRSEAAAAEVEDKFRVMTDSIPQLAWMARADGHIFWYNRRWHEYTGTTLEEMQGWGWEKVHDPAVLPAVTERWRASLDTGEPFDMTFPLRGADGRFRPFLTRVVPTRDATGRVVRWFGTNTDVTEQRELEQALRDAAGRFRTLTEAVPQMVWTADPRGNVTFLNRRWDEYTGVPLAAGREARREMVHPDDAEEARAAWDLAVANPPDRYSHEFRLRRAADGAYRWMLTTAVPLRDEAGAVAEWVGSITDIDDQKRYAEVLEDVVRKRTAALADEVEERTRAEAEVREQRGFLDAILANVADGIVACDAGGELTLFNRAAREFHGLPPEPGPRDRWAERYSLLRADGEAPLAADEVPLARALAGERVRDFEFVIAPAGLPRRTVLASGQPLIDDGGRNLGAVVSMRDVTDRKEAERKLRELNTELVRSNAELEQFAYIASHDLQEPLRKIQAFGDRLTTKYRAAVPEAGREYIDRMQTSAGRMRRLINDLLDYSRVTSQARPFARLNLTRLVREVVSDLLVEGTGADVRVADLPEVEADPTQMRQLFQNLIANAVKFHRPGVPPVVEVSGEWVIDPPARPGAGPDPVCRISVRDNGIGFDEKYLGRIFQVFQRLHGRDEYEGTGVGLAVCRKIAERHGGSITAHSRPGDGATFVVTLPARQAPPPTPPPPGPG